MTNRNLLLALAAIVVTALCSCGSSALNGNASDSTLCQFNNIDKTAKMRYTQEGDTFYLESSFQAFWPTVINGKPCTELQQALLMALTDSAQLNTLDLAMEYLLKPSPYLQPDSMSPQPVDVISVVEGDNLSSSEINVKLQDMGDRLLTYHIYTYEFMARAAHGIYSNRFVTYDLKTGKTIGMQDIIADTTLLRTTILKSIKQTYDYSEDDLFIPENGLLPLPTQFYFKDNVLHAAYQVYDIASYAQGAIDAPIYPYMLKPEEMKRLFTPYGLELIDYTE